MSKYLFSLIVSTLLLLSPATYGWNTYGHLLFTDYALAKLAPSQQREYNQLAYSLVKQMDTQKRLYLMRTFEGTSAMAQLSVFPDDWRDIPVATLYADYAQEMPAVMEKYADTTTNGWHYINQIYQTDADAPACQFEPVDNVASVLPDLITAFKTSTDEGAKALSLAFILHLVADIHNPVHTVSRVDDECESDLGGNRFCVSYHRGSRSCEENLHQAWDRALGFFEEYEKVADAAHFLNFVETDERDVNVLDPQIWASEGLGLARLVYSASDGSVLDPYYIDEGKIISYERIALGGARLALLLQEL